MRFIFIPNNLKPISLLEWDISPMDEVLQPLQGALQQKQDEQALKLIDTIISDRMMAQDRYAVALLLLHKATIEYQTQHWEHALASTQRAIKWIKNQVTQISRHNLAIAHYWQGMIHYLLQSDDKAAEAFTLAEKLLAENERHWGFENNLRRVSDCQNLIRWIRNLLDLHHHLPTTELVFVLPLYELVNRTLIRIGAIGVTPYLIALSGDVAAKDLKSNYVPLEINTLPFLYLPLEADYVALKVLSNAFMSPKTQIGNILIVETMPTVTHKPIGGLTTSFTRHPDGHIRFPKPQEMTEDLNGIPRFLIKDEDEPWVILSISAHAFEDESIEGKTSFA